ncbi:hypothetical protein KQX54_008149 [Cotesia glomerata]|uniref:Uncharacterized protein n=1 Tax=Cotesia glomerata TaxID=32391 RepID=A0AAV7J682_COTGL|nr:hypothetical protein KQX54_008149 [Cotesia glomerata]
MVALIVIVNSSHVGRVGGAYPWLECRVRANRQWILQAAAVVLYTELSIKCSWRFSISILLFGRSPQIFEVVGVYSTRERERANEESSEEIEHCTVGRSTNESATSTRSSNISWIAAECKSQRLCRRINVSYGLFMVSFKEILPT